jgi:hypothetical protein
VAAGAKGAGKADGVAGGAGKKAVPNPNGRKGGEEHQGKVGEVKADIESRGLDAKTEQRVDTRGGTKDTRFVDVAGKDADGNIVEMHQIGKQTKGGKPVSRETKALDDIERAKGARPQFHPYN